MAIIYISEFKDVYGVPYELRISDKNVTGALPEEIDLATGGVEISWNGRAKEDVVFSSSCTIIIESNSDRKFIDLYKVEIGSVRLDILRDGANYWSGTIDTELYEEPYSNEKYYEVSLTFSDFTVLDRKKWDIRGFKTVKEVIEICLDGLEIPISYKQFSSTSRAATTTNTPDVLPEQLLTADSVLCDNFFDEEGESLTLREVLEAVLQPYDLRIQQKNGDINVWDWNALSAITPTPIEWDSDDAVYSVDKVYNNIRLTFSPYAKTDLIDCSISSDDVKDISRSGIIYNNEDREYEAFELQVSDKGKFKKHSGANFFKIVPRLSGSNDSGLASVAKVMMPLSNIYADYALPIDVNSQEVLMTAPEIPIYLKDNNLKLKINLQVLISDLIDPFSNTDSELANAIDRIYVPVRITLTTAEGKKYYYTDDSIFADWWIKTPHWTDFILNTNTYRLSYYSPNWNSGFFKGFQNCKKYMSPNWQTKNEQFHKSNDADYIPLPPVAGLIKIEVLRGIWGLPRQQDVNNIKWVLYKDLKVIITNQYFKEIKSEDEEFNAYINKKAKEDLTIDTIVGTLKNPSAISQGQIFDTINKSPRSFYKRAGRHARLEQLLIGTMYSQYATRHIKLSGTVVLLNEFTTATDTNEPEVYAIMGELQNLLEGTSEIEMVQISPDDYNAIEYD